MGIKVRITKVGVVTTLDRDSAEGFSVEVPFVAPSGSVGDGSLVRGSAIAAIISGSAVVRPAATALAAPTARGGDLQLWVYGDAGVTSAGGLVSSLADQSRQGDLARTFTAAGSFRPTLVSADPAYNNRNTLSFNGTTNWMAGSGSWVTGSSISPYTAYVVGEGTSGVFFASGPSANRSDVDISAGNAHAYAGSNLTTSTSVAQKSIVTVVFNGASSAIYVNGSAVTASAGTDVGSLTISTAYLGGNFAGGNLLSGKIAAVVVVRGADSARARAEMVAYLAGYYGVTADATNKSLVICDGDSLTSGQGSTGGASYPAGLLNLLGASSWDVTNDGTSGHKVTDLVTGSVTIDEAIASGARPRVVYVPWAGTNDIYSSGTDSAALFRAYSDLCRGRRSAGARVIAVTILPRTNTGTPAYFEHQRQQANAMIRAGWPAFADELADVAASPLIGGAGCEMDTTYFDTDRCHLNNAGYDVVEGIVYAAILRLQ